MIPIKILGKRKDQTLYLKTIRKIKRTNDIEELARQLYYNYSTAIEVVYLIIFDFNGDIINIFQVSIGDMERTEMHPRNIITALVLSGLVGGFSIIHNHVSEVNRPSENDFHMKEMIQTLANIIDIDFYQCLIATQSNVLCI